MQCSQKCECIPIQLIKTLSKKRTIQEIDLQSCNVEHLHSLNSLKGVVQMLYLASNRIQILDGLPTSLQYLDLSNNSIKHATLDKLTQLKTLRISNNLIETFDVVLPRLEILDISHNYLTEIPIGVNNVYSIGLAGNCIKNYENDCIAKFSQLIILDGCLLKQSTEQDYIINMQEQQLAQKFTMNVDYLGKWRQEVFKLLVQQKAAKILTSQHLNSIKCKLIDMIAQPKHQIRLEQMLKQIAQQSKRLQHCVTLFKKQKQHNYYENQIIINSLKGMLDQPTVEEKPDKLIKQCIQFVQQLKMQRQQTTFEKELLQQENELLKAQADHFQQMYNQIRTLNSKNDESAKENEKQKGFQQLYQQIRQLEEEKLRFQLENQNCKELKNLEVMQIRSQYEQQIALLQQELEFHKSKLPLQQEEMKIRLEQISQQYEKRMQLQDQEHESQIGKIRNDYQQLIDGYILKEQQKNSEILKYKDQSMDLDISLRTQKQEYEYKLKEYQSQVYELHAQLQTVNQRLKDSEIVCQQLKQSYQQQYEQLNQVNDMKLQESNEVQNQLQSVIHDQSQEISDLKAQKKHFQQQNNDLVKVIEMKDGVIRQLTLQKPQTMQKTLQKTSELEQRAMQILQDDD